MAESDPHLQFEAMILDNLRKAGVQNRKKKQLSWFDQMPETFY